MSLLLLLFSFVLAKQVFLGYKVGELTLSLVSFLILYSINSSSCSKAICIISVLLCL